MGSLQAPIAVLAAGGTKTAAAWAGLKDVFMMKVLGPMGMVVGAATSFLLLSRKLVGEWKKLGMSGSKEIERLTLQFKPLLGSMAQARERAKELFEFGAKTPFEFPDVASGGKMLEALTRGGLSTGKGLTLVGDAAAVAGTSFSEMSQTIGRLYDGLQSGRPVGVVAMRLQELGVISGQTRNQIEAMQEAGADGNAVWAVAEKDIGRVAGAMKDMEQTLSAMESNFADVQMKMQSGFSDGFLEGEKAALGSTIKTMEAMTPVAVELGQQIGALSNWWQKLKARVVDTVTSWAGFKIAASSVVAALTAVAATIVLATGAAIGKFVVGMLMAAGSLKAYAAATAAATAATAAQTGVTGTLMTAKANLLAMLAAVRAGKLADAMASLKLAAANVAVAFKTNAAAAAQVVLVGGLKLVWVAIKLVTTSLWGMATAWLATPMGRIISLLLAAGAALAYFANKAKQAREELEAYQDAARGIVKNLEAQIRAIRTVADLRAAEATAVKALAQAYAEYYAALAAKDPDKLSAASTKVADLESAVRAVRKKGPRDVEKTDAELAEDKRIKDGEREATQMRLDGAAGGSAEAEAVRAAQQMEEARRNREKAEADKRRDIEAADKRRRMQQDSEDKAMRQQQLEGDLALQQSKLDELNAKADVDPSDEPGKILKKLRESGLESDQQDVAREIERITEELRGMEAAAADAKVAMSKVSLEEGSELGRVREQLAIYEEMAAAKEAEANAQTALTDAKVALARAEGDEEEAAKEKLKTARMDLDAAKERLRVADAIGAAVGVDPTDSAQAQRLKVRRDELQDRQSRDIDPATEQAARDAYVQKELEAAQARLAIEGNIAGIRLKGFEREAKLLDIEREKLELEEAAAKKTQAANQEAMAARRQDLSEQSAKAAPGSAERRELDERIAELDRELKSVEAIGDAREKTFAAEREILAERKKVLEEEAAKRKAEISEALQIAKLRREEAAAREKGYQAEAGRRRAEADALEDARTRREALEDARAVTQDPAEQQRMVDEQVRNAQEERDAERARQKRDQRMQQYRSRSELAGGDSALQQELLRRQGRGDAAKKLREKTAREKDDLEREEARQGFVDEGFTGDEAREMANRKVKQSQVQRLIESLGDAKSPVVASSLAEIGGGGNTYGGAQEKSLAFLERIAKAVEQANDPNRRDIEMW